MADFKAYMNQIETVDDYLKFKDNYSRNPPMQTSKALGSLNDLYDDPNSRFKKEIPKQSQSEFEIPLYKDNNYMGTANSQYLGDSNYFKENMIPFDLKEDHNMNKLSKISEAKVFGNEVVNESLVENSFLKQLNIKKTFNIKNMFDIEKPEVSKNDQLNFKPPSQGQSSNLDKYLMKSASSYSNSKPLVPFDQGTYSGKYTKPNNSLGSSYNKFKLPDRPDVVSNNYIDNNDIRAYLNSLDTKIVSDSKSQSSNSKSRSSSANPKKKAKAKNTKMDLSIIEDDMEGEEQERPGEIRRKTKKMLKQPLESSDSESEVVPKAKKTKHTKRIEKKNSYEEDLTNNYSEKELSLQSANHFNEQYKRNKQKMEFSDNSLPSKTQNHEYFQRKYGKDLPKENAIMEFLDEISEVICVNCNELVDLNSVDEHSSNCFKAMSKNSDDITNLNSQLKQIVFQLKKKLKNIKEYINKHEDSEHYYFNYTLMIIECLQQIIKNDYNIVKLVSNIKDINAFNKSLSENETPLSKFLLSITYRIKPIAKLKITSIEPKMTWFDAKNIREQSVYSQNCIKPEGKSMIFRDSNRYNMGSVRSSMAGSNILGNNSNYYNNSINKNNVSMMKSQNGDGDDGMKKQFMQMVVNIKLNLDRNHPGRNYKFEELYNEVRRKKIEKDRWNEVLERKFEELLQNQM